MTHLCLGTGTYALAFVSRRGLDDALFAMGNPGGRLAANLAESA